MTSMLYTRTSYIDIYSLESLSYSFAYYNIIVSRNLDLPFHDVVAFLAILICSLLAVVSNFSSCLAKNLRMMSKQIPKFLLFI